MKRPCLPARLRIPPPSWKKSRLIALDLRAKLCDLPAFCALLTVLAAAMPPQGAAEAPFATHLHAIPGLIHQVWPLEIGPCSEAAAGAGDLLVLSTEGGPPNQTKRLTWMPCGSALRPGDAAIVERAMPLETVLVDVATLPGRRGPQLIRVDSAGLHIEALQSGEPARDLLVPGGLPLPPNPWETARLEIVADWNSEGRPSALVPALEGARLIDLTTGTARTLHMPVYATYRTWMPYLPAAVWKWMIQQANWPTIARGDDNGDGRPDLFALSRYEIAIFHAGPNGLPSRPSRRIPLTPFDEESERQHGATANNYFARDLNGDGLADLLLSTIGGGITDGESTTRVYLNSGQGVDAAGTPAAERRLEGGVSGFTFIDIDSDGQPEMLETSLEFGVLQIVGLLLTRKADAQVTVLTLDPAAEGGTRTLFEDDFALRLDFGEGSVTGLVPTLGDWNGDGRLDFYVTRGDDEISFRLGSSDPRKPLFGAPMKRQKVPIPGGESRILDLNGDGLDEIVSFNDRDPDLPLVVFENLGRFPDTANMPRVTAPAPGPSEKNPASVR